MLMYALRSYCVWISPNLAKSYIMLLLYGWLRIFRAAESCVLVMSFMKEFE
jgi:hypothetical protein